MLIAIAILVSFIALVFCTSVGIKLIMEEKFLPGLLNITLGGLNLLMMIINIMQLVGK